MPEPLLLTVITPSYMQGRYISQCIDSVRRQGYGNIEHIILDACSSDDTLEVVERNMGTYNLTFIREKDTGQANAINKGLAMAKGDIVCWLNADDMFFNAEVVGKVVNIFLSNPGVNVVTGGGYYIDEPGNLHQPIFLSDGKFVRYDYLCRADFVLQPSTFWRRNEVRLDEGLHYAFDWKFFIDLHRHFKGFLYTPDYFSKYRLHADGKTVQDNAERKKEICHVLEYGGACVVQRLWAKAIYGIYLALEKTGLGFLKKTVYKINLHLGRLTEYRLFSG
jgi:glycosyltransferase involved in cell wall biosynthesis